jgi:hypothetical protein
MLVCCSLCVQAGVRLLGAAGGASVLVVGVVGGGSCAAGGGCGGCLAAGPGPVGVGVAAGSLRICRVAWLVDEMKRTWEFRSGYVAPNSNEQFAFQLPARACILHRVVHSTAHVQVGMSIDCMHPARLTHPATSKQSSTCARHGRPATAGFGVYLWHSLQVHKHVGRVAVGAVDPVPVGRRQGLGAGCAKVCRPECRSNVSVTCGRSRYCCHAC